MRLVIIKKNTAGSLMSEFLRMIKTRVIYKKMARLYINFKRNGLHLSDMKKMAKRRITAIIFQFLRLSAILILLIRFIISEKLKLFKKSINHFFNNFIFIKYIDIKFDLSNLFFFMNMPYK